MENIKKMTIAEAKQRIEREFSTLMTKKSVLRLLDSLENCCDAAAELKEIVTDPKKAGTLITKENKDPYFDKYVEFKVLSTQSVHKEIQSVALPNAYSYRIILFNSQDPNQRVFALNNEVPCNTGSPNQYFSRPDGTGTVRYKKIQEEMKIKGINEIIVRVSPI